MSSRILAIGVLASVNLLPLASGITCTLGGTTPGSFAFQELQSRVDTIRQQSAEHGRVVETSPDLLWIQSLEGWHLTQLEAQYGPMHGNLLELMNACGATRMAGLERALARLELEAADHAAAMSGIPTAVEGHLEESRHQQAMVALLDSMDSMLFTLEPVADGCE